MTTLFLDLETYSDTPIRNGGYKYAENAEILLCAWAVDDGPVRVDEGITEEFRNALLNADEVVAHNSQFDRVVLERAGVHSPIRKWHCTMARALAHSLPGGLDALCTLFKLSPDQAKLKEGKDLVRLFCMPRPKNMKLRRATKATHPAEWERFVLYAGTDVEAMRVLYKKLPRWNYEGEHLNVWHVDQIMNDRGVAVDLELAAAAVQSANELRSTMADETEELTGGEVDSTTQRDKLLQHILREYGVRLPDMKSSTIERRINDEQLPDAVRQLLALRLEASQTSSKKFNVLLNAACADGRLRGLLQFCGAARTGRWSGRIFQPQNLTRPPEYLDGEAYDLAVDAVKHGVVEDLYDKPMEVIGAVVRGALIASPGHHLIVADLNAIEARVLAWLGGDQWVLDAFNEGQDIYKAAYSMAFGVPYADVTKEQRQIGKVMILALGYQGAVGAVRAMAGRKGEEWSDAFIVDTMVKPWRASREGTVQLWYDLERSCKIAVAHPDREVPVARCPYLKVKRTKGWLRIKLPSGRSLSYPFPEVNDGKLSYMGINQYTRKWERIDTYGGKLVENVVQAIARDIMAGAMVEADAKGLCPVLSVHDELIGDSDGDPRAALAQLVSIMSTTPEWAPGLPLRAEGYFTKRYRK